MKNTTTATVKNASVSKEDLLKKIVEKQVSESKIICTIPCIASVD